MRVPALTMAVRSLRVGGRDGMQFLLRGGLVGLLVVALLGAVWSSRLFGAPGRNFFTGLCSVNFLFLTLLALSAFSSVITEEKEADTLGLLELAGFRPISILLGKSIGQLVTTVQLLLAQLPFAVLAVTLGGVSAHQVYAAYAVLAAYALLLYGIALCASALSRTGLIAARLTALSLALFLGTAPLGRLLLSSLTQNGTIDGNGALAQALQRMLENFASLSPLTALGAILSTGFQGSLIGPSVWSNAGLGVLLVLAAWVLFRSAVVLRPGAEPAGAAPDPAGGQARAVRRPRAAARSVAVRRSRAVASGASAERGARRRPRPRLQWRHSVIRGRPNPRGRAFLWKDFHFVAGGVRALRIRAVLYGIAALLIGLLVREPGMSLGSFIEYWGIAVMAVMAVAATIEAGVQAGRVFREEIQNHTLFGLALVPRRIGTWAFEKVWGSMAVTLPAAACFAVALGVVLLGTAPRQSAPVLAVASSGVLFVGSVVLFATHVTMLLSLYLRKGAFPATIALFTMAYSLMTVLILSPFILLFGVGLLPVWMIVGTIGLHGPIGIRLKQLAGR